MNDWHLYLIQCKNGTLYTGIATDVERRLEQHRSGKLGSKYLRGKGPLQLVFQKKIGDRSLATRMEGLVKKLTKETKWDLVQGKVTWNDLFKENTV